MMEKLAAGEALEPAIRENPEIRKPTSVHTLLSKIGFVDRLSEAHMRMGSVLNSCTISKHH